MTTTDGVAELPRGAGAAEIDAAASAARRLIVLGTDTDLAAVLTRLLRTDRLDVEVALVSGRWRSRRALSGTAQRVPLIRDDTGHVIVRAAEWRGTQTGRPLRGEAVVDDTVLFDGDVPGVRIEPTSVLPGLRAAVLSPRGRPRRWTSGRAAQLGAIDAVVLRDGVPGPRPVRRSSFYRHTEGWLRVR